MNYDANNPFIQLPKIASGSETTKYADYYYGTILGNTVMRVGGPWTYTTKAGLSSFDAFTASPDPYYNTGARLLKKPL